MKNNTNIFFKEKWPVCFLENLIGMIISDTLKSTMLRPEKQRGDTHISIYVPFENVETRATGRVIIRTKHDPTVPGFKREINCISLEGEPNDIQMLEIVIIEELKKFNIETELR